MESVFAMRGLRIAARLAVGFSAVAGLLLVLVLAVAFFGHLQRETLAAAIDAAADKDAAIGVLKGVVQDRSDYLREMASAGDLHGALREGGEVTRLGGEYARGVAELERMALDARDREALSRLQALEREFEAAVEDVRGREDDAAALSAFQSRAAASTRGAVSEVERLAQRALDGYKAPVAAFVERGRAATVLVLALVAAIAAVVVAVAWGITRGITRPLRQAVEAVVRVSTGDLTGRVEARGRDEAADLLRAVGDMNARLGAMVTQIRSSAKSVALDADRVAEGNEQLAETTEEQASSLEESASTIEEFTSALRQGAENAAQASALAVDAARLAREGGASMREVVAGMASLGQASQRIREIVGVIDRIAFQTNILALNAAVEAARAGEQGRGFAVVAAEVRALAQGAATSAKEIGALVGTSVEAIAANERMVERAGGNIAAQVEAVDRVSTLMEAIAATGREQSAGIEQINRAITQMDAVVQKNAALVSRASAAARGLNGQASGLVQSVETFRLPHETDVEVLPAPVERATGAGGWIALLTRPAGG